MTVHTINVQCNNNNHRHHHYYYYLLKTLFSSQCETGATGDYHEIKN